MFKKEIRDGQGNIVGYEARLDEDMRKDVLVPAQRPQGRGPDERYRVVALRSTCRISPGSSQRIHRGPYAALWQDEYAAPNPDRRKPGEPGYSHTESLWLPNEYVVTRHDEDKDEFEVLLRTTDRQQARRFFDDLEDEYPESDLPRPKHGGARNGAGRPAELDGAKLFSFDMPAPMRSALVAFADRRGISRAEAVRLFIATGLTEAGYPLE